MNFVTATRAAAALPNETKDSSAGSTHHPGIASSKLIKLASLSFIVSHFVDPEGARHIPERTCYRFRQQVGYGQSAEAPYGSPRKWKGARQWLTQVLLACSQPRQFPTPAAVKSRLQRGTWPRKLPNEMT